MAKEPQVKSQSLESLLNTFLKMYRSKYRLSFPFSRYCCSKVGWYCHPLSEWHGMKEFTEKWHRGSFKMWKSYLIENASWQQLGYKSIIIVITFMNVHLKCDFYILSIGKYNFLRRKNIKIIYMTFYVFSVAPLDW